LEAEEKQHLRDFFYKLRGETQLSVVSFKRGGWLGSSPSQTNIGLFLRRTSPYPFRICCRMFPRALHVLSALAAIPFLGGLADADETPSELVQARSMYEKELEFATRPLRERYLARLETLKRSLGGRGDARAALAVQEEIDRVTAATQQPGFGKFAGAWIIQYENGGSRRYAIKGDGMVIWVETDGKPQGETPGKMRQEGSETVVEMQFSLERISISGEKLMVEHFAPKSDYPRKVTQRGTGVKQGGK